jgi:hypothetical protein
MKQRNSDACRDFTCHPVHRVGTDEDEICAAAFKLLRRLYHFGGQRGPITIMLQPLNLTEIDRKHQAARRMNPAKPFANPLIDDPVILGRAFPTHPADQANHFHVYVPIWGWKIILGGGFLLHQSLNRFIDMRNIGHAINPAEETARFVDWQDRRSLAAIFGHARAHRFFIIIGAALEFG